MNFFTKVKSLLNPILDIQLLHEVHGLVDALLDPALDVPLLPVCEVAPGVAGAGASVVLAWDDTLETRQKADLSECE